MMTELIDILHDGQCSLVILHEGKIRTFNGQGLRQLYDIAEQEPELLLDAKMAIKALGRTAARKVSDGGVVEVWADVISEQALQVLQDAGIRVRYDRCVDHNRFLDLWKRLGELNAEQQ